MQRIDYNPLYASIAASSQNLGNAAYDAGFLIPEVIRESKNIIGNVKDLFGKKDKSASGQDATNKQSTKKESSQMAQGGWFPGKHLAAALGGLGGRAMNTGEAIAGIPQAIRDRGNPLTNQTGLFQGGEQNRMFGRFRDAMEGGYQAQRPGQQQEMSFGDAFKDARGQGLDEFTWQGKKYHTKTKEEMDGAQGGTLGPGAGPGGAGGGQGGGNLGPFHPSNRGSLGGNIVANMDNIHQKGTGREGFIPDYLQGKEGYIPDWLQGKEGWIPDFMQGKGTMGPNMGLLGAVQGGMGNQQSGGEGWIPDYWQGKEGWIPDYFQGKEGLIPDWIY